MLKKIVFMGTPMFAVPILKSLYQNGYPISCVYTQPPQKSKRGQKINKSPIQLISETLNIEFRTPNSLKENLDELEYFKSLEADLAIVVAYGQIIPKSYLNLTKNSSLAAAIAYPDLVLVFAGTALMQTGKAIEIVSITMLTYLSLSISISILMNWYNKKIAIKEK